MDFAASREAIQKLEIKSYKDKQFTELEDTFVVQYNPAEYNLSYEVEWESEQAKGETNSEQIFKGIKPSDLSLTFTLDGTGASGEKIDVQETLEKFLNVAYNYKGDKHQPRYLQVLWGTLDYKGVLKTVGINHTMFQPDGRPLRVKLDVALASVQDAETQVAENQPESPDLTHYRVVKDGDTLPLLSYEIYGDVKYYLDVARVNRLGNYRKLKSGTKLIFPPLKEVLHEGQTSN